LAATTSGALATAAAVAVGAVARTAVLRTVPCLVTTLRTRVELLAVFVLLRLAVALRAGVVLVAFAVLVEVLRAVCFFAVEDAEAVLVFALVAAALQAAVLVPRLHAEEAASAREGMASASVVARTGVAANAIKRFQEFAMGVESGKTGIREGARQKTAVVAWG